MRLCNDLTNAPNPQRTLWIRLLGTGDGEKETAGGVIRGGGRKEEGSEVL